MHVDVSTSTQGASYHLDRIDPSGLLLLPQGMVVG